jgi:signal transduction histidine kinase
VSVLRSLLLVLAAATALAGLVVLLFGVREGVVTWVMLLTLGCASLTAAHALVRRRARLGSLRRQFAFAVAIAVGQLLVAMVVGAQLMFVSGHDAAIVLVITALAGIVAVRAAQLFAGGVMRDIDGLRETLAAVGEGSREPCAATWSADELAELAAAANATIEKLGRTEGAKRDLVAAVSHDLRTPITSLQLLAEAVDDDIVDPATRRRYTGQMSTHIRALSDLIDDLFELSRLEAGEIRWTLQQVSVEELVAETVEAMRPHAEARGVQVRMLVPPALEPTRAHPEKLQRVLFNLLQNAIRHTPADGSVTVLAEPAPAGVHIEVADTGAGIGEADRGHVFEPSYRGGAEAGRTRPGAGLGLAISRAIVEAHGGRIWLEEADTGTRVRFWLPREGGVARAPVPVRTLAGSSLSSTHREP